MNLDLTCPSTHQLLWNLVVAPDLTRPSTSQLLWSTSLVLARASLAAISKLLSLSGRSAGDYTSSCPPSLVRLLAAASLFFESRFGEDLSYTPRSSSSHPRVPDPGPLSRLDIVFLLVTIDRNDWNHYVARLINSRDEERRAWSGFQRVDDNAEMSIYDFMTLPSWSDAKIVEESHHLSLPLLQRVPSHTTAPAGSSAPELDRAEGTDEADLCVEIEDSLERDEGISMRVVSAPTPRLGKRLDSPPSIVVVSASEPSHIRTSAPASTSGRSLSLGGDVASGRVRKSGAEVMRRQMDLLDCLTRSALARDAEYDQIPNDDFGTATRGEEIDLTLFPLAPGPYRMPYTYEGVSFPLYTKVEWDGPHLPESNILRKDIFKDLNVCMKALDWTITQAELRRTESLLPLELSNRVNVLSALLVSHGYELNSHYTNLENKELCSQRDAASEDVKKLQSQLTDAKAAFAVLTEELTRTNAKLSKQALTVRDLQNELSLEKSKSQGYKDAMDGLKEEAKPNKRSGDADLSKDKSGPESPLEFWRSWYVEGHIRSGVISSVLMQRCQRKIRQRYSPCEGPLSLE
ncbi:hypothetical protein Tco_0060456 [Tanacetum coccineum]